MNLSLRAAATEAPEQMAVVTDETAVSYAKLERDVRRVAAALDRDGLGQPQELMAGPIAALATRDCRTWLLIHALIALGRPLVLVHPRWTSLERRHWLERLGSPPLLDAAWVSAALRCCPAGELPVVADDERPLVILATSGSSREPRGVVLSRRAILASARASNACLQWRPQDRWLASLPLAHVGGLSILTRALVARGTVVFGATSHPEGLLDLMDRQRVTLASFVPTQLARVLDGVPERPAPRSLRAVLVGGADASPALRQRLARRGWPALYTYGLTETASQVTLQRPGESPARSDDCGRPLPGTEVRVREGRIVVRSPTLLSATIPPASAPLLDPEGYYETGDLGWLDESGALIVAGRNSDLIITGGENVAPQEVEHAALAAGGVLAACAFPRPDETWGQVVALAVVPDTRAPFDPQVLFHQFARVLAPFKRPRHLAILTEVTLGPSGKPDRQATASRAAPHLVRVPARYLRD